MTFKGSASTDSTLILLEDFDAAGAPVPNFSLCVEHRCTRTQDTPFMSSSVADAAAVNLRAFSICGPEGFKPQDATWTRDGVGKPLRIEQPPPLAVEVWVLHTEPGHGLRFALAVPQLDRVLIWAGKVDSMSGQASNVYWTSEMSDINISQDASGVAVSVPPDLFDMCLKDDQCEVVAQVVRYWPRASSARPSGPPLPDVVAATEWRGAIDFRGAR